VIAQRPSCSDNSASRNGISSCSGIIRSLFLTVFNTCCPFEKLTVPFAVAAMRQIAFWRALNVVPGFFLRRSTFTLHSGRECHGPRSWPSISASA
jgi:hypothetical protein